MSVQAPALDLHILSAKLHCFAPLQIEHQSPFNNEVLLRPGCALARRVKIRHCASNRDLRLPHIVYSELLGVCISTIWTTISPATLGPPTGSYPTISNCGGIRSILRSLAPIGAGMFYYERYGHVVLPPCPQLERLHFVFNKRNRSHWNHPRTFRAGLRFDT